MADWKEIQKQINELREEYKADNGRLLKENRELKEMLKTVAKDISSFKTFLAENNCRLPCEKCLFYNCGRDKCEYMHMPEIIKLIGGENDDK